MTRADDSELRSLQARAYGPHADIQLDPDALRRLRELEGKAARSAEPEPAPTEAGSRRDPAVPRFVPPVVPAVEPGPVEPGAIEPGAEPAKAAVRRAAWPTSVNRPSVPVAAALVLAAALVVTGLLVLRSDQGGPLQAGATQIARLPVDASYKAPPFVGGPGQTSTGDKGFREFHGLRAVILPNPGLVSVEGTGDTCMAVYPAAEVTADEVATGYSGHVWTGCAAGEFPATVQFRVTSDLPADVRSGFPKGEALRFVYDPSHHDVVVSAAR